MKRLPTTIDVFDKIENKDLALGTKGGMVLSFVTASFGLCLILNQFYHIFIPKIFRDLNLDASLADDQDSVNMNIDVQVGMPCFYLHMYLLDIFDYFLRNINDTVAFHRLSKANTVIGQSHSFIQHLCLSCCNLYAPCCSSCKSLEKLANLSHSSIHKNEWLQSRREKHS